MSRQNAALSKAKIEDLLQECLSGYDHGLSPEECLAPFADRRADLEPLFRSALSLRITYATSPREDFAARTRDKLMFAAGREVQHAMATEPRPEFKQRARDRFMFAAGREVSQALASEPNQDFKFETRQKLIYAAGAAAQEALRNVPPPKLPFWVNTRRHLLEAASRPAVKPAHRPISLAFSTGMSLAGIVAAVVIAFSAYFYTQSAPTSVGAEFAAIEQQTLQLQNQQLSGTTVSVSVLADLTRRTNDLAARLQEEPTSEVAEKLQPIIDKQREVLMQTATVNSIKPPGEEQQLREASVQLAQAEVRVQATRSSVSPPSSSASNSSSQSQAQAQPPASSQPAPQASNNQSTTGGGTTSQPSAAATPAKAPSTTTQASNAPAAPVGANQVRVRTTTTDTFLGQTWVEVRTADVRFVAPASWIVAGLQLDANGIATVGAGNSIGFSGPEVSVIVNLKTNNFDAVVNSQSIPSFQRTDLQSLFVLAQDKAPLLRHMVESVQQLSAAPAQSSSPPAPVLPKTP